MTQAPVHTGFSVSAAPEKMQRREAMLNKQFRSRLVGVIISTILSAVFIWRYQSASGGWGVFLSVETASIITTLLLLTPAVYGWVRFLIVLGKRRGMRRALDRHVPGTVMQIQRPGLVLRHTDSLEYLPWDQVKAVYGVKRWDTPGPEMRVERIDGSYWTVPFVLLDVLPGSIDGGLQAYSGRRMGLDMLACDDIW